MKPFVILRTSTDPTGHVTIVVITIITGDSAELEAWKMANKLNHEARSDNMEVYIVRKVGEEEEET